MSDPFPRSQTEGKWETIRSGHELVFLGGDRMLDWKPDTGEFRLWAFDANVSPNSDPLPGRAICEGKWSSISRGHELIYLFKDALLDWEPSSGKFRVWRFDRNA